MTLLPDKPILRTSLRAARDAFAAGRPPLAAPAELLVRLAPGLTVAAYIPVGGEADPSAIAAAALAVGAKLALPHVTSRADPLRFLAWHPDDPLHTGPFDLRQPHHDAGMVAPDVILTPLVGFDRRGNRLGQGAGHYDRAFAAHPQAWRVGVAWRVQEVAALPADPWDVPLHAIVTDAEWIVP